MTTSRIVMLALLVATPAFADEAAAPVEGASASATASTPDAEASTTAPPTQPKEGKATKPVEAGPVRVQLFGSLRPTVGVSHYPDGIQRDRWGYGATGSSIDVGVDAQAGSGVSGGLYVNVHTTRDQDGATVGKVGLESAVIRYEPIHGLVFIAGRDGVPLSAQSATPTIGRVYSTRIVLNDTFVLPADVGAQARYSTPYVSVFTGVWNGIASDAMLGPGARERGFLYSGRIEVTPLGPFEFSESTRPSTVRIGIGLASTYRAATTFTQTGTEAVHSRDLRAAASIRAAYRGLFVQAELLRKQITDDLSSRPDVATAGYVQASWRFRAGPIEMAPLARAGLMRVRQLSMPETGSSLEVGAAFYPLAKGSDRLQVSPMLMRIDDPDSGPRTEFLLQARLGF
jgi:hypothetical protein